MALRFNAVTGQMEDDGMPVRPLTGAPIDTAPDDVQPGDLIKGDPLLAMQASRYGTPPAALAGGGPPAQFSYPPQGEPFPVVTDQPPVALPSQPVTPAPAKPAGGGGGQDARLQGDLARVQGEQERALSGEQKVAKEKAGAESEIANDSVKAAKDEQIRLSQLKQETEAEHARLSKTADDEDRKYKQMGFTDFWSKASIMGKPNTVTGARIVGLIATALGTAGASLGGGRNYAVEAIDKLIANDYQRQRDEILKQKDAVSEARGMAREAKADKLLALENWRKNAYELADREAKARIAQMGPAAVDAKGASALADLHEKAIESKQALEKGQATLANIRADTALKRAEAARQKEAGGKGGQPSAQELGAAADASGILTNLEQIGKLPQLTQKDLEQVNKNRTLLQATANPKSIVGAGAGILAKGAGAIPNSETEGLDAKKQQAYLAWQNVRSSMAHVLTGAGMSDSEREDYIRRYTPQPGDDNSTIAGKFVTARQFVKDQLIKAGRAAGQVQPRLDQLQNPGGGGASAAASKPARIRLKDGRIGVLGADGQYYLGQ